MEMLWFKILSVLIIFAVGLLAGIMPTRVKLSERGKRKLTLGNAFSGGVFLGAGLLHLLPDAVENFEAFAGDVDFPFAALICGAGFLLVLSLEKAALGGSEDVGRMSGGRVVYPFVLCFVLSIHSIIAGASLGLEGTLASSLALFIAIIAHKGAAAFALGVSLRENDFSASRHVKIISFFSAMTPLGIVLGALFSRIFSGKADVAFEAVFDALAAGTFLYIAVVDIIEEVFQRRFDRWLKVLLIIAGFGLMALVAIWA